MRYVKKLSEPDARTRFLLPEEKERLFKELQSNKQLLAITLIAVLTGWRRGQILSLRKSSLDSTNQSVRLIKSKRSKMRAVPVSSVVWEILTNLAEKADDYLFLNPKTGKQLLDFDRSWKTACTNANVEGLHFHDLRRTFAVEMLNLKAGEFLIQSALGHSNIETTKIYAQVQNTALRDSLDTLANSEKIYHSTIIQPSSEFAS